MNPITRKRNSDAKKGHKGYGRPLTDDERAKISKALSGRKLSEEHKTNLSIAHKKSEFAVQTSKANIRKAYEKNVGRQRSDETKEKIRNKMVGVFKGKHWKIVNGKRVWE